MDGLSLDSAAKVVLPLITFALGVVITLVTKRVERARAERHEHLKAMAKLANDWYNQLHELSARATLQPEHSDTERAVYSYVHNRLILPELMLHLEYIRERGDQPSLEKAVEDFLSLVTTFSADRRNRAAECRDLLAPATEGVSESVSDRVRRLTDLLPKLDRKLQTISRLTARALAT